MFQLKQLFDHIQNEVFYLINILLHQRLVCIYSNKELQKYLTIYSTLGTYNLDDSGIRPLPPVLQSSFKSTSKRDAFSVQSSRQVFNKNKNSKYL